MINSLNNVSFNSIDLDSSCVVGLLKAKWKALAILHDCPNVKANTIRHFNQLSILPDLGELEYSQPDEIVWLACAIKAIIEADTSSPNLGGHLERYAHTGLEHAGRILKYTQGIEQGAKAQADKAAAELEKNRQKADAATLAKGESTTQSVIDCYDRLLSNEGNFKGLNKAIAKECGITPARVTQILSKRHNTKGMGES